jgi:hypothetical protein
MAGCGSSSKTTGQTTSNLKNRAFVTNTFYSTTVIVDAMLDKVSAFSIRTGGGSTQIVPGAGKNYFAVIAEGPNAIVVVKAETEEITGVVNLPAFTESIALKSDGSGGYAAVKNAAGDNNVTGVIDVLDFVNQKITATITIKDVRWISMNPGATTILAFSDQSDTVNVVDLTKTPATVTPIAGPFSRPVNAYWASDDKAYIISCGVECGASPVPANSKAGVTELTVSTSAMRTVALPNGGATVGLLDGTTLYVAGTPNGTGPGTMNTINTGSMTVSGSQATIGPAFHGVMALAGGKVWVGAKGCGSAHGCLSAFNTSDRTVAIETPTSGTTRGDVTGMAPITGRNVIYVIEGAQLQSYDVNTFQNVTPFTLDIKGAVYGVLAIP